MSLRAKAKHEIEELAIASSYFACWIGSLMAIKTMLLSEYHIRFSRWSMLIIGVLVLAKVVLVLDHVPLGKWIAMRPAWLDALVRTVMYSLGVILVLLLEHGISDRHEYGGFFPAVAAALQGTGTPHFWVNVICVTAALAGYNLLRIVRKRLGDRALINLFITPLSAAQTRDRVSDSPATHAKPTCG